MLICLQCDVLESPDKYSRCARLKIPYTGYGVQRFKFLPIDGNTIREEKGPRATSQRTIIVHKQVAQSQSAYYSLTKPLSKKPIIE